jgi:hypothetical protein
MSAAERNELIEDASSFLRLGDPPIGGEFGARDLTARELIARLLEVVKAPWRSECDRHVDSVFQCHGCVADSLDAAKAQLLELKQIHHRIEIFGENPNARDTVAICVRCREIYPCETLTAIGKSVDAFVEICERGLFL